MKSSMCRSPVTTSSLPVAVPVTVTLSTWMSMLMYLPMLAPLVATDAGSTTSGVTVQPEPVLVITGLVISFRPLNVDVVPVTSILSPMTTPGAALPKTTMPAFSVSAGSCTHVVNDVPEPRSAVTHSPETATSTLSASARTCGTVSVWTGHAIAPGLATVGHASHASPLPSPSPSF